MFIRMPWSYDRRKASIESGLRCTDESRAVQSSKDECDINTIMRRFGVTGQMPKGVRMPTYADFESAVEFQSAMNAIAMANESFDSMPSEVRDRFHNNPAEFVDFVNNEANRAEAEKFGLLIPQVLDLTSGAPEPVVASAPPASPT